MSIRNALSLAREHLKTRRLAEVEVGCRAILQADPEQGEAVDLPGLSPQRDAGFANYVANRGEIINVNGWKKAGTNAANFPCWVLDNYFC